MAPETTSVQIIFGRGRRKKHYCVFTVRLHAQDLYRKIYDALNSPFAPLPAPSKVEMKFRERLGLDEIRDHVFGDKKPKGFSIVPIVAIERAPKKPPAKAKGVKRAK
jgi:hypothetical protein